jgi:NAD(P)-dependent dehydrogenase (short-subunit alcohol dehydrogenase family)
MKTNEFENRIVMITGAASGIGRACARAFAEEGAVCALCDIDAAGLERIEQEIGKAGLQAAGFHLDVSDESAVTEIVKTIEDRLGPISVLVNSAGIIHVAAPENITGAQWDRVLNVNLRGTFFCCREVAGRMNARSGGAIVNITAAAAKTGGMNVGADYVSSKGGISSLTRHFARKCAPHGVRVNAVSPGPVDTPMLHGGNDYSDEQRAALEKSTPLGMGYPEDIAYGVLFLASPVKARFITGETLDIDGGHFMD